MTREIKFRGKDIETGEWVCGDLLHVGNGCIIATDRTLGEPLPDGDTALSYSKDEIAVVNPDTVGQFTGLLDKNGKEIYEGDIMRIPETEFNIEIIGVVEFVDRGSYVVRSFLSGTHSSLAWAVRERQPGEQRGVVIGNIHDNPELLKGGAE